LIQKRRISNRSSGRKSAEKFPSKICQKQSQVRSASANPSQRRKFAWQKQSAKFARFASAGTEIANNAKKGGAQMANPLKKPKVFVEKEGDIFVLADPFGIISVLIFAENVTEEQWAFLEANIWQVIYAPDFIL